MERKISLDIIRSFAILAVLLLHSLDFMSGVDIRLKYFFAYGWIGVDLFFVLSGFLIGQQIFNSTDANPFRSTLEFWIKRLTRTLPLYFLVLCVYLFLKPIITHQPFNGEPWRYFLLIQNYFSPKDFVQSWSLCIEEQFYLLFPIFYFFLLMNKAPKWVWILPAFLSLLIRWLAYKNGLSADSLRDSAFNYQFPLHTHLDGISYGLFLAATKEKWTKWPKKKLCFPIGIISLLLTCLYIEPTNYNEKIILSYHLLAFSFSLLLIGLYDVEIKQCRAFFSYTALWSYGIYLWNNLIARILEKQPFIENNVTRLILFLALSYLLSFLSYEIVEKPGMKLRNIFFKKSL